MSRNHYPQGLKLEISNVDYSLGNPRILPPRRDPESLSGFLNTCCLRIATLEVRELKEDQRTEFKEKIEGSEEDSKVMREKMNFLMNHHDIPHPNAMTEVPKDFSRLDDNAVNIYLIVGAYLLALEKYKVPEKELAALREDLREDKYRRDLFMIAFVVAAGTVSALSLVFPFPVFATALTATTIVFVGVNYYINKISEEKLLPVLEKIDAAKLRIKTLEKGKIELMEGITISFLEGNTTSPFAGVDSLLEKIEEDSKEMSANDLITHFNDFFHNLGRVKSDNIYNLIFNYANEAMELVVQANSKLHKVHPLLSEKRIDPLFIQGFFYAHVLKALKENDKLLERVDREAFKTACVDYCDDFRKDLELKTLWPGDSEELLESYCKKISDVMGIVPERTSAESGVGAGVGARSGVDDSEEELNGVGVGGVAQTSPSASSAVRLRGGPGRKR